MRDEKYRTGSGSDRMLALNLTRTSFRSYKVERSIRSLSLPVLYLSTIECWNIPIHRLEQYERYPPFARFLNFNQPTARTRLPSKTRRQKVASPNGKPAIDSSGTPRLRPGSLSENNIAVV